MDFKDLTTAIEALDLRSCLVNHDGQMLFEYYRNPLIPSEMAKINSCTKSILSALICIAMDRRIIPEADTLLSEFYPQLLTDPDPRKRDITLEHLLTMTAGFQWTEFGGIKSFPRMTRSDNWVDFVLEQPISDTPGSRMEYSSGVSQLLSAILVQACGTSVARFAEDNLFGHLGIEQYEWEIDPQGNHTGGYGMRMRPGDLLKFGQLYLNRGSWEQQQLVSAERANFSVKPFVPATAPNTGFYGWHWWADTLGEHSDENEYEAPVSLNYFYARGYAGQFIYVVPDLKIVVVLTDDKRKKDRIPGNAFLDSIAPLLLSEWQQRQVQSKNQD
ncbi:serine hydrolase domain-containing protein [Paenibacillus sp. NPDC058071]|uniref:serine hydrolase domain-containing protein n=1 Tax=Paenibacillus sp. NPDC058071 TaxID=3346326 RepID=UPI0036DD8D9B